MEEIYQQAIHEITCGKCKITILKIKLVKKQITYFWDFIQLEIITEQVSETGKKRISRKTSG